MLILLQFFYSSMCGICFILGGASIHKHDFSDFNFFKAYLKASGPQQQPIPPLNEHILNQKLLLPNSFMPAKVKCKVQERGPDCFISSKVDMFKVLSQELKMETLDQNHIPCSDDAFSFQSILHMRGDNMYIPDIPGSEFLFNGEIWHTGNLEPIDPEDNDAEWLHRNLIACKGSRQKIKQLLQQIRGDFAFVFIEGEEIFIAKDYFGKRSLMLGMSEDYFIITSVPIHTSERILQEDNQEDQNNQDEGQQSWKQKYQAQWHSSKNKYYFEIPANSLISVLIQKQGTMKWTGEPIFDLNLSTIPKDLSPDLTIETIKGNVKKLLIQNLKELTKCIHKIGDKEDESTKVGVLFSGGIDSTLIARMLDFVLPKNETIDLVNLSFRADAPDRESGLAAYKQLKILSPDRKYNLILLDKKLEDVEEVKKHLMETIYPKSTHMDFNISGSLMLASTGTKSRIIMTGLGADEIFSGYSRYRIACKRAGLEELEKEMIFDMERLWIRNLGRDDRAIGSMAKQVRYPFLYLPLWTYLRSIPIGKITQGTGQKALLRSIAQDFGLQQSSTFKKRAIQFGTRLAKLSNVKCFGSNRKAKGNYQYR